MLRPLHDKVLAEVLPPAKTTAGGLVIPDIHKENAPQKALVRAVGPGRRLNSGDRAPLEVAPGDMVLVPQHAGTRLQKGGKEHVVLVEDQILAVLED